MTLPALHGALAHDHIERLRGILGEVSSQAVVDRPLHLGAKGGIFRIRENVEHLGQVLLSRPYGRSEDPPRTRRRTRPMRIGPNGERLVSAASTGSLKKCGLKTR